MASYTVLNNKNITKIPAGNLVFQAGILFI